MPEQANRFFRTLHPVLMKLRPSCPASMFPHLCCVGVSLAATVIPFWTQSNPVSSLEAPLNASNTAPQILLQYSQDFRGQKLPSPSENFALIGAQSAPVRSLTLEAINGDVLFNGRPARIGDQLTSKDDIITTGDRSTARLRIDTQIGLVELASNTTLQVDVLSGGNQPITGVYITRGRARFSISKFVSDPSRLLGQSTHPHEIIGLKNLPLAQSSSTESAPVRVRTPAGVAGVRGTSFGVNVGPDGKTGITALDGIVGVFSQGREILLNPGFFSVINPEQEPNGAEPLPPLANLRIQSLSREGGFVRVVAQADPMDLVYVNNQEVITDPDGKFDVLVRSGARVRIVLRGPAVRERYYNLTVR